jgi:hypothetical protein
VVEGAAELASVLFSLVEMGADGGAGGQLPTSEGRELTEYACDGG